MTIPAKKHRLIHISLNESAFSVNNKGSEAASDPPLKEAASC